MTVLLFFFSSAHAAPECRQLGPDGVQRPGRPGLRRYGLSQVRSGQALSHVSGATAAASVQITAIRFLVVAVFCHLHQFQNLASEACNFFRPLDRCVADDFQLVALALFFDVENIGVVIVVGSRSS